LLPALRHGLQPARDPPLEDDYRRAPPRCNRPPSLIPATLLRFSRAPLSRRLAPPSSFSSEGIAPRGSCQQEERAGSPRTAAVLGVHPRASRRHSSTPTTSLRVSTAVVQRVRPGRKQPFNLFHLRSHFMLCRLLSLISLHAGAYFLS
jgi:hypothetical protein